MVLQIQVTILQVDFSLRGACALEHLKELSVIYHDIATYILNSIDGVEENFDVFQDVEDRLLRVAGEKATKKIYLKVNRALSKPSLH